MKRCGIVLNSKKEYVREYRASLIKRLSKQNIEVWSEDDRNLLTDNTDLIIILGGDGTTLRACRNYLDLAVPFICINFGKVGFLSSVEPQEFFEYLPKIINQDYQINNRSILQVAFLKSNYLMGHYHALNEVVIRSKKLRLCHQSVYIDGYLCLEVEGDGIICSTPTGSTAYSLSAGGPIVDNELDSIIITPICSRNSSVKPYIASPKRKLQIRSNDSVARSLMIDGEEVANLTNIDLLNIKLSTRKARFIEFNKDRYFKLLPLLSQNQNSILTNRGKAYSIFPF